MSSDSNVPDDILDAVRFIREAGEQKYLTRSDKDNLNRAKLRIAFWALRSESIVASRENLSYILGVDAAEIMGAYDRYLEREDKDSPDDRKGTGEKRKRNKSGFWENA